MKKGFFKKFSFLFLAFVLMFSFVFLVACDDDNRSKADVKSVYDTIAQTYCNSQGYFYLPISPSVVQAEVAADDKYQIFPKILDNFIDYASGAVFSLAARQNDFDLALSSFSKEQLNIVYDKFSQVLIRLKSLEKVKSVYENSDGYLLYNELVCEYFYLIDALYSLTDSFSVFYLNKFYLPNFTVDAINSASVSTVLWGQLYSLSKVSYVYELKNYLVDEGEGAVENWLYATDELRPFIVSVSSLLDALKVNGNITQYTSSSNKTSLSERLNNMLSLKKAYDNEYDIFLSCVTKVNLKEYLSAPSRSSYLKNASTFEKSRILLIQQFLTGRYRAFTDGLSMSITLLNLNI